MAEDAIKELAGMQKYPIQMKPYEENLIRASEAKGELAGLQAGMEAERSVKKQKALSATGEEFAQKVREAPQRKELEEVSTQMGTPFIPTQENAQNLGSIFALVNIAGFALGSGGKRNSIGAMSAMNGMLKGYQQGRQDLYKKEKDVFDINMKQLKSRYDMLDKQLKDAIETYKTDKQAGIQAAELAYAEAGADFMKRHLEKFGLAKNYDTFKDTFQILNRAETERIREEQRAEAQRAREQQARETLQFRKDQAAKDLMLRREMLALRREGIESTRQKREERDAKLSPVERKEVRGFENLQDEITLLKQTFKPEYANFKADVVGDVASKFKARFEDNPEMAEWWRRYENVALPERHSLFGATLTGGERDSWRKASIGPGSSDKEVASWITDKERVLKMKLDRYDRTTGSAGGAGQTPTPSFNSIEEAEKANLPKGTKIIVNGRKAEVM
jgi:hypothetical protein